MNSKNALFIVLALIGIGMFFFSMHIMGQVEAGRQQIYAGQRQVDQSQRLFNLTPVTKEVGKEFTGSAQKRIDAGSAEADYYQQMANWLKIGGIVLIIVGVGGFIYSRKK